MRKSSDKRDMVPQDSRRREILYIGNIGSSLGQSVTVIETLGTRLAERFRVHRASGKRPKAARLLHMLISVVQLRKRIDIVLIDTYSTTNFFYAFAVSQLCRLLALPYIPILHGGNLPTRLARSPVLSRRIFLNSLTNVAPSPYLENVFRKNGFPATQIPNSISVADYPFTQRKQYRPRLLFVRALAKVYNPKMAVRVLANLSRHYPSAELCMVGPDRDDLLNQCRKLAEELGCAERILFAGRLSKPEWHQLSERYDIFINTSDFDNMPVSVIEAMALGLAVISTNPGGMSALIEDGKDGLLVARNDSQAMAERVGQLLKDGAFALELAMNARRKVEQFDWQVVKHHWYELLG